VVTSKELVRLLTAKGCKLKKQGKGSHEKWLCGDCMTVIPMHNGDIPAGTLRAIQRQLEPCLGKDWWKK
jgi:predicted RNA binding protein YcfA (HicA-like mRNA interferase family)